MSSACSRDARVGAAVVTAASNSASIPVPTVGPGCRTGDVWNAGRLCIGSTRAGLGGGRASPEEHATGEPGRAHRFSTRDRGGRSGMAAAQTVQAEVGDDRKPYPRSRASRRGAGWGRGYGRARRHRKETIEALVDHAVPGAAFTSPAPGGRDRGLAGQPAFAGRGMNHASAGTIRGSPRDNAVAWQRPSRNPTASAGGMPTRLRGRHDLADLRSRQVDRLAAVARGSGQRIRPNHNVRP